MRKTRVLVALSAVVTAVVLTTTGSTQVAADPLDADPLDRLGIPLVRHAAITSLTATGRTEAQAMHRLSVQRANGARGSALVRRLGDRAAGTYLNRDGDAVVTVLDAAAAGQVREAGLIPRIVRHSAAELTSVQRTLDRLPAVPSSSWYVDPVTNKVRVTVSAHTPAAAAARLRAAVRRAGDRASITMVPGRAEAFGYGGDAIYRADNARCSIGFNATDYAGNFYTITAGHCTRNLPGWNIGPSVDSSFPGSDYGLIQDNPGANASPGVDLYDGSVQPITSSSYPYVGEEFCKSGSRTGLTCGAVTGLDCSATYAGGAQVYGLICASTPADHGDSGGSAFDGEVGIGMVSGGDGSKVNFFYQPLQPAIDAYGLGINY